MLCNMSQNCKLDSFDFCMYEDICAVVDVILSMMKKLVIMLD